MNENFLRLGAIANDTGRTIDAVFQEKMRAAEQLAQAAFARRHASISSYALTAPLASRTEIPGWIDAPPPIPTAEGAEISEVAAIADLTVDRWQMTGARRTITLQKASSFTPAGVVLLAVGLAEHLADGIEDELADLLDNASLPGAQVTTSLPLALDLHARMTTPAGGLVPAAGVIVAAAGLRAEAAAGRWEAIGIPVVFSRSLATRRIYVLPPPPAAALAMPCETAISMRTALSPNATLGFEITATLLSAPAQMRTAGVIRATLP